MSEKSGCTLSEVPFPQYCLVSILRPAVIRVRWLSGFVWRLQVMKVLLLVIGRWSIYNLKMKRDSA